MRRALSEETFFGHIQNSEKVRKEANKQNISSYRKSVGLQNYNCFYMRYYMCLRKILFSVKLPSEISHYCSAVSDVVSLCLRQCL